MSKRKPYQKPEINQVELKPEEAVLTGCKMSTGAGGVNDKCFPKTNACKDASQS